jgi:DNA-binding protein HU-beta
MIEGVLRTGGLTKANVERFYDAFAELVKKKLVADKEFVLPGLGVLVVKTLKARDGRNPRTGERIRIPRRKAVRFRPYREIRLLLNPGLAEDDEGGEDDEALEAAEPTPRGPTAIQQTLDTGTVGDEQTP